jgi:arsenate reductase
MELTIFHNPRCSKSRQTLALLEARGLKPQVIEYLATPPDAATLSRLIRMLGVSARDLIRKGEPEYRALGLDDPALDDAALVAAMTEHPRLIERPIVVAGNRARIGRPPETVLELL